MEQTDDWRKKYFTDEQLKQMEDLSKQYSEEAQRKIAAWGKNWTEARAARHPAVGRADWRVEAAGCQWKRPRRTRRRRRWPGSGWGWLGSSHAAMRR